MSRATLEAHLEAIAKAHHVVIQWRKRPWSKFEAHLTTRSVYVGPPTSALRYFCALHEIGHVACEESVRLQQDERPVTCEAAAWEWAFEHALAEMIPRLSVKDREKIADGWATYLPRR